jgi:hypothetical protein
VPHSFQFLSAKKLAANAGRNTSFVSAIKALLTSYFSDVFTARAVYKRRKNWCYAVAV